QELNEGIHKLDVKATRLEMQQQTFYNKLWEEYELTYTTAKDIRQDIDEGINITKEIKTLKDQLKTIGSVNLQSIEEYKSVKARYEFLNQQKEGMEKTLHETINERKEVLNADLPVSYNVHIDNPEWLLNAISKKEDTYLMLLPESATEGGLKGYEQYKHLLNDLHCPILLFPDDIKYAPLKKMVVATNYQKEDIRILDKLRDLAKHYQSKVLTLHVNEGEAFEYQLKEKGFEQILEEKVDYPDINFKAIDHDEAEKAIGEFSERIQADLLVLHKGHRNIFEKLFSKSRARKIIEKVHMPVLVFNDHTLEKGT
ncbi:MAG: universal stress protein, partial [Bacteroidota bacterium]